MEVTLSSTKPPSPSPIAEKLQPGSFATQPKLLSVNLTNNLIDDVLPGAFANLTRLVRLILTRNRLGALQPASMTGENARKGSSINDIRIDGGREVGTLLKRTY